MFGLKKVQVDKAKECAKFLEEAHFGVVLTGAGISTSAGIPDFRGPQGIYTTGEYDADKIFDFYYFLQDPRPFYNFARDFLSKTKNMKPTFTHNFIAALEKEGKIKGVITQNIDALHQLAGSKNIIELHGGIYKSHCVECGKEYSLSEMREKVIEEEVPLCDECKGIIKPDIVFFGEEVLHFRDAEELTYQSDLFFVIGSALAVYPAAMLPNFARGKLVVVSKGEVNIDPISVDLMIDQDIDNFFRDVSKHYGGEKK